MTSQRRSRRITKGTRTEPKIAVQIYLPPALLRATVIEAEMEKAAGQRSSRNAIIEAALRAYLGHAPREHFPPIAA